MSAIRRAIEKAGSQEKLANAIGVTQAQVAHWRGGDPVNTRHFQNIERATGVTAHELLEEVLEIQAIKAKQKKTAARRSRERMA